MLLSKCWPFDKGIFYVNIHEERCFRKMLSSKFFFLLGVAKMLKCVFKIITGVG